MPRLVAGDRWESDGGATADGPWQVKWRTPLLPRRDAGAHRACMPIGVVFAPDARAPQPEEEAKLAAIEGALRGALEVDLLGVLVAVATSDGERVFVFYVRDEAEATARLASVRDGAQLPIEVEVFDDPGFGYLRDEVLDGLLGGD